MAKDDAGEIAQDIQQDQGWSDATLLEHCLEYINNQGDNQAFQDYLSDQDSERPTVDPRALPSNVLEALQNRGHMDRVIARMTPAEVFDEWCMWEGLIGWGPKLRRVWDSLRK